MNESDDVEIIASLGEMQAY